MTLEDGWAVIAAVLHFDMRYLFFFLSPPYESELVLNTLTGELLCHMLFNYLSLNQRTDGGMAVRITSCCSVRLVSDLACQTHESFQSDAG